MSGVLDALATAVAPERVFAPGSESYAQATTPDNSSFVQQPAAVVRARTPADVAATVRAAAAAGVRVAVQTTGHGAGEPVDRSVVLVDTSALDALTIDADARTARVGGGVRWGQVQAAAQSAGLLGLAGTSATVGVAGYTVNGGVGWLARPHGLASGALRAVEYVDGRGAVRRTDAGDADPDALWAFRGGAALGIVTELEFALFPVPDPWAGYLLWPGEHLPALAAAWLDGLGAAPPGLTSALAQLRLPPEGPFPEELLGTVVTHLSYASVDGEAALTGLRTALSSVASPLVDTTGATDAVGLAAIHLDPPAAVPGRGIGEWVRPLTAEHVVAVFDAAGLGEPDGLNMIELRHVDPSSPGGGDGALTRVPAPFLLHAVGGAPDDAGRASVDARLAQVEQAAAAVSTGRSAPGFREGQPGTGPAYPAEVLDRLLAATARNDPDRVFAFHRVATAQSRLP